jgi:hypothetical protein
VESKHAVFVESAIDGLAYKQLPPEPCFVISTAGATTAPAFVDELVQQGLAITVAYDNDETGQDFAAKFLESFPAVEIEVPRFKDWNADLRFPSVQKSLRAEEDYFDLRMWPVGPDQEARVSIKKRLWVILVEYASSVAACNDAVLNKNVPRTLVLYPLGNDYGQQNALVRSSLISYAF